MGKFIASNISRSINKHNGATRNGGSIGVVVRFISIASVTAYMTGNSL